MQFQRDQRQIFSIRKFKAYGAASVLLGLMTLGVNDKALAEQIAKAQGTPDSGEATQGTSPTTSDTLETESLLITQADAQVPTTPAQADKAPEAPVAPSVEAVAPQASYAKQLETARQKALKELEALKGDLDHDSYTSYSNQIKAATDTDAFDRILKRAKAKAEEHKAATKLANPAKPASSEPVQAEATDALAAEDTSNLSYKERLASARAKALSQLDALKADLSADAYASYQRQLTNTADITLLDRILERAQKAPVQTDNTSSSTASAADLDLTEATTPLLEQVSQGQGQAELEALLNASKEPRIALEQLLKTQIKDQVVLEKLLTHFQVEGGLTTPKELVTALTLALEDLKKTKDTDPAAPANSTPLRRRKRAITGATRLNRPEKVWTPTLIDISQRVKDEIIAGLKASNRDLPPNVEIIVASDGATLVKIPGGAEIDNIPGAELLRQGYLKDKYLIKRPKNFSYVVGDIKNLTAEEYDHIVNAYKTANASIPSSELLDITISGFRRSDGFFYVYSPMTILVTFADDSKISLFDAGIRERPKVNRELVLSEIHVAKAPIEFSYVVRDKYNLTPTEAEHIVNAYKLANTHIPSSALSTVRIARDTDSVVKDTVVFVYKDGSYDTVRFYGVSDLAESYRQVIAKVDEVNGVIAGEAGLNPTDSGQLKTQVQAIKDKTEPELLKGHRANSIEQITQTKDNLIAELEAIKSKVGAYAQVAQAKQAAQAAQAKKTEVERDGLVTPADKQAVDALIQTANQKVATARQSVSQLPSGRDKTDLERQVNGIRVVGSPVVNDANSNGILDTTDAAIRKATADVEAAKQAAQAAQAKKTEVERDGLVTPADKQAVDALIQTANQKVATARQSVSQLPSGRDKTDLERQVNGIRVVGSPVVNDANSNGILDTTDAAIRKATADVEAAKQAAQAAQAKKTEVERDGLVTPADKQVVDALIQTANQKVATARQSVSQLPSGRDKTDLERQVNGIRVVGSPVVNDANSNGILDTTDAAIRKATADVEAAKQAAQAAQAKKTEVERDGLVTPADKQVVDALIQTANQKVATARQSVSQLPSGRDKTDLERQVNGIRVVGSPVVNDANSNGILDTTDAAIRKATADVEAAKQAAQAAQAKKTEVERDGLVTPADKQAVDALIQTANQKVATARQSVSQLPSGRDKTDLERQVNGIRVVGSPVVNDANSNGILDTTDAAIRKATADVEAAKQAAQAAQAKKTEVERDGLVTPADKQAVDALIQTANQKVATARQSVSQLPSGRDKTDLERQVNGIRVVGSPVVNDANSNGILDTTDAAIRKATADVEAAKQAAQAAQAKKTEVERDGLVTPADKQVVDALIQTANQKVATARQSVSQLPSGRDKTDLERQVNGIRVVGSPVVNDANSNGILDTTDAAIRKATADVEAAKQAAQAAQAKKTEVERDGLVTPADKQVVDALIQTANQKVATARQSVSQLPSGRDKTDLERQVNGIRVVGSPVVNDANSNGILDTTDAAIRKATADVEAAKQAAQAAQAKKTEVERDGLVTPADKQAVDALIQTANQKVATARQSVSQLPSGRDKTDLERQVNGIRVVGSPVVNDANSNGILDTTDAAIRKATADVEAAKQAAQAAQAKKTEVERDGLVTPADKQAVDALIQTANQKVATARQSVSQLPSGRDKTDLERQVNGIRVVGSPVVNDANSNGILDTTDAAIRKATADVEAAKQAAQAAQAKKTEVERDGLVTPADKQVVDALIQTANQKVATARQSVSQLPSGRDKTDLERQVNGIRVVGSPVVNDANSNGILDTTDAAIRKATADVEAAKQAAQAAQAKKTEVERDGLVTPADKQVVDALIQTANQKVATARQSVSQLPSGRDKTDLERQVNGIRVVGSPVVNDANSNGILDTTDAAIRKATADVEAAKQAAQAAQAKKTEVERDGLVTPADKQAVDALIQTANQKVATARQSVSQLPSGRDKTDLERQVNGIRVVGSPVVNDANSNGILDTTDAAIRKATADVEAAKQAAQAAATKKEEVEGNNLVTPTEKQEVDALLQTANEKVQAAKDSVGKLPESEEKTQLTQDANGIQVVDSPVVTDANPTTGTGTTVVKDPSGTVTVTDPNGTTTTVDPKVPGTTTTPGGATITVGNDGKVTVKDPQGNVTVVDPATGTITTTPANPTTGTGTTVVKAPSGTVTVTDPNGTTTTVDPKVPGTTTTPGGTTVTVGNDNKVTVKDPKGNVTVVDPTAGTTTTTPVAPATGTDTTVVKDPAGTVTVTDPNGTATTVDPKVPGTTTTPGGTTVTVGNDNKVTVKDPKGTVTVVDPTAGTTTTTPVAPSTGTDTTVVKDPAGTVTVTDPNGTATTVDPKVPGTTTTPGGTTVTVGNDNKVTVKDPKGTVTVVDPATGTITTTAQKDEGKAATLANPYQPVVNYAPVDTLSIKQKAKETATLPSTGETNSSLLATYGALGLMAGLGLVARKKRRDDEA